MGTFIIRSEREMRLQKVKSHCQKLGSHITGAWGMDFVSSSPLFSTAPPFFQNFHINHSFFKIFIMIRFFFI